jgi:putative transposase
MIFYKKCYIFVGGNKQVLTLTYEYKAKPTKEQIQIIEHTLDVCRKVWNFALRERKDWLKSRSCQVNACSLTSEYIIPASQPYPNYNAQAKSLTLAKEQYPELKTVNAQVLQQVLRKLETAFIDMKRKGMGFPRFKNRYRMRYDCLSSIREVSVLERQPNQVAAVGVARVYQVS